MKSQNQRKQSIVTQSLLKSPSTNFLYSVYMESQDGQKFSTILDSENVLVSDAIKEVISKLNKSYGLTLKQNPRLYQLYAAKKNGTKNSGLPSIEHQQNIFQTKLHRFYLQPNYKILQLGSKKIIPKNIQSQFQLIKSGPKHPQTIPLRSQGCFCFK